MSEKPEQIDQIFWAALQVENADERAAFLDKECGKDTHIRRMVEKLIGAQPEVSKFLEKPFRLGETIDQSFTEESGAAIGPYRLLEPIGEGGMGTVYMAEQREPVKRRVAIKLIKTGMDTKQVIARFEAERQALAMMDHPNIAKIHDAGTTDAGRPYFVMELVKGLPITKFCDEQKLSMNERLMLFREVCHAVQHAHQKGIIHRDLKPSNIMIAMYDDRPVPKVIDFGVAKATSEQLSDATFFTKFGQVVGTLTYMSPEQAQFNQLDIDTRSDIYSLGAMLYELMVGEPPFDQERLKSQAFDETLRMIREEEPTKPSTKFSSVDHAAKTAGDRDTTPEKLNSAIRGDLDWIVMKSLEKDRSRRYETASSMADDVQRYLDDEAVTACPPTTGYRLRKLVRRNKVFLTTTSLVFLSLIAGAGIATWQAFVANSQRNKTQLANQQLLESEKIAKQESAISKAVTAFLQDDLLGMANPNKTPDPNVKLLTVLDRAASEIDGKFGDQPLVEAAIRNTIALTYRSLGEFEVAETHQKRAVELATAELGAEHGKTLVYNSRHAGMLVALGRYKDGATLLSQTLASQRQLVGNEDVGTFNTMFKLAYALRHLGKLDQSERLYEESLAIGKRKYNPEHPVVLKSMSGLVSLYTAQKRLDEAEELALELLTIQKRINGNEDQSTISTMQDLARVYREQKRFEDAEKLQLVAREFLTRTHGECHPSTLNCSTYLGHILTDAGRLEEAEKLLAKTLDDAKRELGQENPTTFECMNSLSEVYFGLQRYDEAEELLESISEKLRRNPGNDPGRTVQTWLNLSIVRFTKNRFDAAEDLMLSALMHSRQNLGDDHPMTLRCQRDLGTLYGGWAWTLSNAADENNRDPKKAVELARKAIELNDIANAWFNLGVALFRNGENQAAIEAFEKADEMSGGKDRQHRPFVAMSHWELGDKEAALKYYRQYITWLLADRQSDEQHQFLDELESLMELSPENRQEHVLSLSEQEVGN